MRLTASLVVMLVLCALSSAHGAEKRMNVLFIAVDDLRPQLACYGQSQMKTPNIDALAKRGLLFNRAYVQQAVCSPSRTVLMTGRRPDTTKIYDLETHFRTTIPDVVTLPQHFKNAGYHSQGFGKIYHGGLDDKSSWSVPHTSPAGPAYASSEINRRVAERRKQQRDAGTNRERPEKGPPWEMADVNDDEALPDGKTARAAIKALNEIKDKPFFLAVGFVKPHLPFVAPKKYFDLYPTAQIELPKNDQRPEGISKHAVTNFGELRGYEGMPKDPDPITADQARELIRGYYATVSYTDAQVGRVVAELDRLGLRDNTIIVLWGDHGWHLGEQGQWCKHTNFENATRNALIVSVPGADAKPGAKTDALVETVDLYPTLCELAGLPKPEGLEGTSFVPLLADPSRPWKPAAFSQYPRERGKVMGYSIRTDRYRYTEWQDVATKKPLARELYEHETDAAETVNLAAKEDQAAVVKKLSEQLNAGWKQSLPPS